MSDIEIRLTSEQLDELLKVRDFWSEVVFKDGGEVAPGHDPFKAADFEVTLEAPASTLRDQGWDFDPVFSQSWDVKVERATSTTTASYAPAWKPTAPCGMTKRQAA